jgi:4-amino-4-deoxy-L-arabinose transferase-like glycosyltransferase
MVGVIDVLLIAILARALLGSDLLGLAAGLILALSPAHFIHSRLALSVLFPMPFVLIWLWCVQRYQSRGDRACSPVGAAARAWNVCLPGVVRDDAGGTWR